MNNERQNSCNANKDHIKGIKCDVRSCVYHDCDTHCTASQIAVCNSASNAACETFKEKK